MLPEFNLARKDGKAQRWDPCSGPINIAVNFGAMSEAAQNEATSAIRSAASEISKNSGLQIIMAGATSQVPKSGEVRNDRGGSASILIAFLPSGEGLLNAGQKNSIIGQSTKAVREGSWTEILTFDLQINTKSVVSINDIVPLVNRGLLYSIGLSAVNSSNEVMGQDSLGFPTNLRSFGPGDIEGMKTVGKSQGCIQ